MKITLDGNTFDLTPEQEYSLRQQFHADDIRCDVEQSLEVYEEDDLISFDTFDAGVYSSAEDAREDFIGKCIEDVLEEEELYDRSPDRFTPDYDTIVRDNAGYFDYLKGV